MITLLMGIAYGLGLVPAACFSFVCSIYGMSTIEAFFGTFFWPVYWPLKLAYVYFFPGRS